ncbi:MAG: PQQ-binding-like beta-propeller repeat protein [Rhodococcus sp. (in: high G+C Gram-positive bacteria)]|uniref:outer membrane protein assembly factor BamB family protein n=1 Tax=Rhodococcus sp. TaxID=1831 RepID=UPI002ADCF507|nr:PQQ-binding-like beta-propeller repeat protein [Rhodococcus sp. (in: high G+C Gram-positive bacteria)]MDZ7931147.1 PQQ-binding-like beta-propeller repeat protein [Rhodococcus sp. (in: high G+C Gram-positive bacteria)]
MTRSSGTGKLVVAGVVAALSVSAAVFVVAQDRSTTIKKITDSSEDAPGLAWSVDAADIGPDGAVFVSPRTGSIYPYGAGAIRIGDVAMTLAVVSDDLTATDATMAGIDTTDGTVLWTTPAPDLASCADEPLDGMLVCHQPIYGETPGYVTFDPNTGESRQYPTDIDLFAMTVANDRIYTTSGNLEDDDVLLHRGTLDNPSADWTVPLHAWAGWEDDYVTALKVGENIGTFDVGGGFSTFDASTGRQLWKTDALEDCLGVVGRTAGNIAVASAQDCTGTGTESKGSIAFRLDGTVLAQSNSPVVQQPLVDEPTDTSIPIILGETAFDRTTGEQSWSDDALSYDFPGDELNEPRTYATLNYIIGHVGLLQASNGTTALDLRNGEHLWQAELDGSIFGHDGDQVLSSNGTDLSAIDITTGETAWTAQWEMMFPEEGTGSLDILVDAEDGSYLLQSGSKLAMLQPLP